MGKDWANMSRPSRTGTRGLYKDATGRWSLDLRWRDPMTAEYRRYRERFAEGISAAAAKVRAREILASALAGKFDPTARKVPRKVSAGFDEYVNWCEANHPARQKKKRAACDRVLAIVGDKALEQFSALDVERFKRDRLKGGGLPESTPAYKRKTTTAPATVNRDLEVLFHFFGLAASWGWVTKEKADAIREVQRLKEPPGRVRHMSLDEETKLIAALPVRVQRIVLLALLTGMRQQEVVLLKKSAVDVQARQLMLTKTKSNKTRPVYLNEHALAIVNEAIADSKTEHVFASRTGKPYTCDGVRSIYRRACVRAGLTDLRFHDTRHTTATRLRREGAGLDLIAKVLGHAGITMVLRYAHLGQDTIRDAMATLPVPRSATAPPTRAAAASSRRRAPATRMLGGTEQETEASQDA